MGHKLLKKKLSLFDLFCIASGAMISSGIFILPGLAYAKTGSSVVLAYILACIFTIPAMLSKAELTTAMPRAGGDYFFISRSMGFAIGAIGGISSWLSLSLKSAFALVGMSAYASLGLNFPVTTTAALLCLLFAAINIRGIKEAGIVQRFLVTGLLIVMGFYIIRGFPAIRIERYAPFMTGGGSNVFATAGFVFISYAGLTKIASVSEEVKKPGRSIPLAMILSLSVVGLLYAAVISVTTGVLDPEIFSNSTIPISDGAYAFMGRPGAILMAVAAVLAFVSTANAGMISASRYPIAMSRDKILPAFLHRINERYHTPHFSIIVTSLVMFVAILFLNLKMLVEVASTFLILLYLLANIAVIIMRESKIQNYQPKFKSPLYPWMQIGGVFAAIFLLLQMGHQTIIIVIAFIIGVFFWYLIYARLGVRKDFALAHLISRITAKEFTSNHLPRELMEIVKERDEIIEDRFDKLITTCKILDLNKPLQMEEFFRVAAESLAPKLNMDSDRIYDLLIAREEETSTVIRTGLAIPHIIVEGKGKFEILLARCKNGITFPETKEKVHIVFVLAGSKEERNFHLRALAAIAEIAQASKFDKNWLAARNIEELRSIILLAERRRFHK